MGIWVRSADGHPVGKFQVLNPKTHKINLTHDIPFVGQSYGEEDNIEKAVLLELEMRSQMMMMIIMMSQY